MNVLGTSSYGDRPMCQIWYANVKANRSYRPDKKHVKNSINLPRGQSSTSYLDHECMQHIILWWYIYVPKMVSQYQTIKKVMGRTQKHVKNPIIWSWGQSSRSYLDHECHGDTPMCPNMVSQCQTKIKVLKYWNAEAWFWNSSNWLKNFKYRICNFMQAGFIGVGTG